MDSTSQIIIGLAVAFVGMHMYKMYRKDTVNKLYKSTGSTYKGVMNRAIMDDPRQFDNSANPYISDPSPE